MIASSTDNLEGCEKEKCKQKEAFPRFVVDGDPRTCFRSHTEDKPWLIVYLGDLQPVSLVRIQSAEKQTKKKNTGLKDVGIFVGMTTPGFRISFNSKCARSTAHPGTRRKRRKLSVNGTS